jgi:hypothetical protein
MSSSPPCRDFSKAASCSSWAKKEYISIQGSFPSVKPVKKGTMLLCNCHFLLLTVSYELGQRFFLRVAGLTKTNYNLKATANFHTKITINLAGLCENIEIANLSVSKMKRKKMILIHLLMFLHTACTLQLINKDGQYALMHNFTYFGRAGQSTFKK